jgi:uncharacterized membrane protein YfcA
MGKLVGTLIGVLLWVLVGYYVPNTILRIVCMGAIIYLTAIYILSLRKAPKGGSDESGD